MAHETYTRIARTEAEVKEIKEANVGVPGYSEVYHKFTQEVNFKDGTTGWELHFERYYG